MDGCPHQAGTSPSLSPSSLNLQKIDIFAAEGSKKKTKPKRTKKDKSKKPKCWSDKDFFGDLQVAAKTKSSKTRKKKKDGMK